MELNELISKHRKIESNLDKQIGQRDQLKSSINVDKADLVKLLKSEVLFNKTGAFLQELNIQRREATIGKIQSIATEAIQEILDNDALELHTVFEAKRQTVNAEFKIYNRETEEEFDIFSSYGGALAHIVSIVLKVVISKLLGLEECLIFDESATFIDDINQVRFAEFLRKISHQLEIQIIFITHVKAFITASDKVIEVKQKNGVSYVEEEEEAEV